MSGSFEKGTGALLTYLAKTATANSEEDLDGLLGLLQPAESEEVAGENLTEALGYNPITYYDAKTVGEVLDELVDYDGNPDETLGDIAKQSIRDRRETIIDDIMNLWPGRKRDELAEMVAVYLSGIINEADADRVIEHLGLTQLSVSTDAEDDPFEDDDDIDLGEDEDDISDDGLMDDE